MVFLYTICFFLFPHTWLLPICPFRQRREKPDVRRVG